MDNIETAIFASGCFWGTQYHFQRASGVISSKAGYIGGHVNNPDYKQVCRGNTGHAEAVEVIFNNNKTDFETLAKLFFETHDCTQKDGQGPDIGSQYRSEIFYTSENQKLIAEKLINKLKSIGINPVTKITPAGTFWEAELYHQNYYNNTGGQPYCHIYRKIF